MSINIDEFKKMYNSVSSMQALRLKVLESAMQGKLVSNEANETGIELFEKILSTREELEKSKDISKPKKLVQISEKEQPFNLPVNWCWSKFGQIVDFRIGKTPKRNEGLFWNNGDYQWVSIADMNGNGYVDDTKETVSQLAFDDVFKGNISPVGTLIMSFKLTVGKVSILDCNAFHNEAIVSVYPLIDEENVFRDYLFWLLPVLTKMGSTKSAIKGNTLNSESMTNLYIPLPPLEVQKRIVEKIQMFMVQIDELEQSIKRREHLFELLPTTVVDAIGSCETGEQLKTQLEFVIENFEEIFQTPESMQSLRNVILQLAIEGKLVEQDPNDEPASVLVERIKVERDKLVKEKKIKKPKKLEPITEDEIPFEIPKSWEWERLNNVIDVRDGTHDTPKYVSHGGYPLITGKDFYTGKLDYTKTKYISETDYLKIIERSKVDKHDILFSMIGGNIGSMIMINDNIDIAIKNVALFKYYDRKLILPKYLEYFLKASVYKMKEEAKGGAQKFLSLSYLRNYLIPIPPKKEQLMIINKVYYLISVIDEMEEKLKNKQRIVELLGTV